MTKYLIRPEITCEVCPHRSSHGELSIFISLAILLALIALPASCSALPSGEQATITITSPTDGAEVWIDVVPPHVAVIGEVSAPSGIQSVHVRSGVGEVSCGNGTKFACSVPVATGENTLTVIAVDTLGHRAEKSLNVTVRIGLPPPPAITVSGRVTDPGGTPIAGATVRFESEFSLDNDPISVTTMTDDDGHYLIEDAIGYQQNLTVSKEGYLPLQREIIFENLTNTLDLELEPRSRTTPGFDLRVGIPALLGALLVYLVRRR
ncbi:carboxypeptidase regulatory-like domain-containing protein [Methanofollis aquaemaris]|uniref:Carboxypeptidase regulatory-like domain-containing protein n=1 Tax=Methanofollis aquaemaris TaxID=126734 RepID=A0A8A3S5J4_9EURY|nr:carboxypeptidase regulatory-like domain-containing protein [Methanofollis aquaemaris]QSZ67193.1 carboxypeptidase regulatory-like domain-containing protein [Methanofollis aquaemaris]